MKSVTDLPRQVVKIVHNDCHKQVECQKRGPNEEGDEKRVGNKRPATFWVICRSKDNELEIIMGILFMSMETSSFPWS